MSSQIVDVIVCHYNKANLEHIRFMALHAMSYLCQDRLSCLNIVLVDGSPLRDDFLSDCLKRMGIEYLHAGRELTFSETYNYGISNTSNQIIVTMANDILITSSQLFQLAEEISDGVGCAIPYLTTSDFGAQRIRERTLPIPRRCFPSGMTLNVNAFSRKVLEQVGLIPEMMSGCFNDVILFIKMRELGYSIVLYNVDYVIHLGQQTLKTGKTSVSYKDDAKIFKKIYPMFCHKGETLYYKMAQKWPTRLLYFLALYFPQEIKYKFFKHGVYNLIWRIEPYICAPVESYIKFLKKSFSFIDK
jgi:glycosyltransferase involved in cell wall biosynthesis